MTEDADRDIAEELDYIADNPEIFKKAEIAVMLRKAAETIRELRVQLDLKTESGAETVFVGRKQ